MSIRKRADRTHSAHLQGTLDLLILRTLIFGPQHGQGIARAIKAESENVPSGGRRGTIGARASTSSRAGAAASSCTKKVNGGRSRPPS
jgi:hypothetical protein